MKFLERYTEAPTLERLRRWNYGLAGLYALQAIAVLLLVLGVILHALCVGVERMASQRGNARVGIWFGYSLVVLCGAGVWLIVALYLLGANIFGDGHIPAHIYWLALTAALTALSFAFGLYRQIRLAKTGARYRLTEARYMVLTVVTTSLLAWQIVAGTMH
jgi:hypothetical protein